MQYNLPNPNTFYQDNLAMMGHVPRFHQGSAPMQPNLQGANLFRSMGRLPEEMRFDFNRNSLHDRQMYQNKQKYPYPPIITDPKSTAKTSHVMRAGLNRPLYTPYPPMPPPNYFKTSPPDQTMYSQQQQETLVPDYCVELLNRDKHYWTDEETGLMLELYEENREYFNDSKTKKTKIWSVIADMVNKRFSTNVNAEQCSQKFRNLKAEFLKVSDPTSVDGGAKKFGRHFQQMRRLLEDEEKKSSDTSAKSSPSKSSSTSPSTTSPTSTPPEENKLLEQPETRLTNLASSSSTTPSSDSEKPFKSKAEILLECLINSTVDVMKTDGTATTKAVGEQPTAAETEFVDVESVQQQQQSDKQKELSPLNEQYHNELRSVFDDYFAHRDHQVGQYENCEKRNIVCMNKCIEVFRSVLKENMLK